MAQAKAIVPKFVHRVIEMWGHVLETMRLVRVRDLLEHDVIMLQRLGERQRLLIVHVVVTAAMY